MATAYCEIPLRSRDGSIRAWTQVDVEDYERTVRLGRWHLHSGGGSHGGGPYARHRWNVNGKARRVLLHQYILGRWVDHRDGNGLNNRRSNLRYTTPSENARNRHPRKRQ